MGRITPNKITMIASNHSSDETKLKDKVNSENSRSKIQNSLVFAIGSVIPNRRVSASRVFTKNQRLCPPLNIKNNFNRNSIFDRHCSFKSKKDNLRRGAKSGFDQECFWTHYDLGSTIIHLTLQVEFLLLLLSWSLLHFCSTLPWLFGADACVSNNLLQR